MSPPYFQPTQAAGRDLMFRGVTGEVTMLNLLRLRDVADYSGSPELAPSTSISGLQAFQLYIDHTLPHLRQSGGDLVLLSQGGPWLIGPPEERWDLAMLVRQHSIERFMAFAADEAYLDGIGHRTAAIEDSRLLPLTSMPGAAIS